MKTTYVYLAFVYFVRSDSNMNFHNFLKYEPETESESNCRIIRFDSVESNRIEYYLTDSGN